ncbi:uncharacterized protein LOC144326048 isoform X2 [Podarcis muralis]
MDHLKAAEDVVLGRPSKLCLSEISGKPRKSKRRMSEQKKSQSLEETVGEAARNGHNPPLSRSKTYDPSYSKEAEKETLASAQHRNSDSNLVKHSLNFRRVFKDFPEEEELLQTFSCAWQRDVPYHGCLYISENHVCFYCSMVHREVKVVIPVSTITILKKANTALLVPNAVCIRTSDGEKFLFGSLRSRETVYQVLRSVCKHLQDASRNNSPTAAHNLSDQLLKISLTPKELDGSRTPPLDQTLPEEPDGADRTRSPPTAAIEPHQAAANREPVKVVKVLCECLEAVGGWMAANRLRLNPDKTEGLFLGDRRRAGVGDSLVLNGVTVPPKDQVRSLGVILDPQLSMEAQVNSVSKK